MQSMRNIFYSLNAPTLLAPAAALDSNEYVPFSLHHSPRERIAQYCKCLSYRHPVLCMYIACPLTKIISLQTKILY